MQVIEEIDRFKRDPSEKGRNARLIARFLDATVSKAVCPRVSLWRGRWGNLSVVFCRAETLQQLPVGLRSGGGDNNILAVALEQMRQGSLQESRCPDGQQGHQPAIKADVLGLKTEDYISENVPLHAFTPVCVN